MNCFDYSIFINVSVCIPLFQQNCLQFGLYIFICIQSMLKHILHSLCNLSFVFTPYFYCFIFIYYTLFYKSQNFHIMRFFHIKLFYGFHCFLLLNYCFYFISLVILVFYILILISLYFYIVQPCSGFVRNFFLFNLTKTNLA